MRGGVPFLETQSCPQGRQEWEGAGKCGPWTLRRELSKCHCLTPDCELPYWLSGHESACNAGDSGGAGLIPGSDRSLGGGHGYPLQYSWLENSTDRDACWAAVHGITKGRTTEHLNTHKARHIFETELDCL